ncbi:uncharacterized protein LOC103949430 isoform X2 [Pyrus x bretschneideri]|uniref:uncharacterized protein LOC103949430 isoform X2 n=1 Tax=Pyrus x bretschneideri TaxID=225117 RepID=UPI00203040C9|nr:uncharacterized protein LOC103949430 isoform X2 [Pyrus x bretschneideri]
MGKQSKGKKSENLGKGKVTPVQIAFIVDRYLCDNNYSETRSLFRTEASSLIAKSPIREAPKSLLSLAEILDEYILLKEQKVILDQEKVRVEQEKTRVQTLLKGMQSVMNTYNAGSSPTVSAPPAVALKPMIMATPSHPSNGSAVVAPVSTPSNPNMRPGNFCSPITVDPPSTKRKSSNVPVNGSNAAKRSCSKLPAGKSNMHNKAKCLFNQPSFSVPTNNSGPQTPQRANSIQGSKSTPFETSSTATCSYNSPPDVNPTCTIFSSKRVTLSPNKSCYTVETNHCISSPAKTSKRESHVKGRLNFDCSDVPMGLEKPSSDEISSPESEKEVDLFDIDLTNFDAIGADFSFTEMLGEFDLHCEELGLPNFDASTATVSGSSYESADGNSGGQSSFVRIYINCDRSTIREGHECARI